MDRKLDKSSEPQETPDSGNAGVSDAEVANTTRRQFSRRVVVGSAVVISLANRPAWATPPVTGDKTWVKKVDCHSIGFMNSIGHASHRSEEYEQAEKDIAKRFKEWTRNATNKPDEYQIQSCNDDSTSVSYWHYEVDESGG